MPRKPITRLGCRLRAAPLAPANRACPRPHNPSQTFRSFQALTPPEHLYGGWAGSGPGTGRRPRFHRRLSVETTSIGESTPGSPSRSTCLRHLEGLLLAFGWSRRRRVGASVLPARTGRGSASRRDWTAECVSAPSLFGDKAGVGFAGGVVACSRRPCLARPRQRLPEALLPVGGNSSANSRYTYAESRKPVSVSPRAGRLYPLSVPVSRYGHRPRGAHRALDVITACEGQAADRGLR
jgi:hypothetical protein